MGQKDIFTINKIYTDWMNYFQTTIRLPETRKSCKKFSSNLCLNFIKKKVNISKRAK